MDTTNSCFIELDGKKLVYGSETTISKSDVRGVEKDYSDGDWGLWVLVRGSGPNGVIRGDKLVFDNEESADQASWDIFRWVVCVTHKS